MLQVGLPLHRQTTQKRQHKQRRQNRQNRSHRRIQRNAAQTPDKRKQGTRQRQ